MERSKAYTILGAVALAAALSITSPACSPKPSGTSTPPPELDDRALTELACERELVFLDSLISERDSHPDFSRPRLAEARGLWDSAIELYLEQEFELALELIAEAINLLKDA